MPQTIIGILFFISFASAQGLKLGNTNSIGGVEFTQTQKGKQTSDFITIFNTKHFSLFARGLCVNGGVRRGEFALGLPLKLVKEKSVSLMVVPYAGVTTDKAFFGPVFVAFSLFGRSGHYFPDPKLYFTDRSNNLDTLYQEATISLTKGGGWQARWERLQILGKFTIFNRFGVERRLWLRNKSIVQNSHFHISPFIDTANKQVGLYTGFRWE